MADVNPDGTTPVVEEVKPFEGELKDVLDPGQEEGNKVKTYETNNHPPEGSPRWNEIYYKAKELDRKTAEFAGMDELKDSMTEMAKHNKSMAEALTRNAKATEAQTASTQVDPKEQKLTDIDSQLNTLKEDKKFALKDNNADAVVELDDQILALTADRAKTEAAIESTPVPMSDDMKYAQEFSTSTEWLNSKDAKYDVVMESAAMALDKSLRDSVPDIKDRLAKVKEEVERRFSYKAEEGNTTTPASNITGAYSGQPASIKVSGQTSAGDIELTEAQIKAAPHMFSEASDPVQAMKDQLRLMAQ